MPPRGVVSKADLAAAAQRIKDSPHVRRTPLLRGWPVAQGVEVLMKMESLQNTGSFKLRGMVNLFAKQLANTGAARPQGCVTMSAGNAGKSFSYLASREGLPAVVVMPDSVPKERAEAIRSLGSTVDFAPLEGLSGVVQQYVDSKGYFYAHPFDDVDLIAGHGTVGLEILEDAPDVDVVVVCCGGGGLVSGVAAAIKHHSNARVVAVEPAGAPTMYLSKQAGKAVELDTSKYSTIAHGLAAPFAGPISFENVKAFVDEIVLVTDDELREATRFMWEQGFVTETSGCAALAAVRAGKLGDLTGKTVACTVSGRNIDAAEMLHEVFNHKL